jgi:phospholipid/cholesterol/gamma-HCH transport system substrate-binding protein
MDQMAKQANRMMIGGFVVVAVILLAASLVVFGSGKFFTKTNKYILYFDGSVKGLSVGAPVLFQGVQIGSVASITLSFDPNGLKVEIPVVVDIEPHRFEVAGGVQRTDEDRRKAAKILVERGLRAVLTTQSFITGQLMIELDFYPHTPANLKNISIEYPEIPTIPSTTERLAQTLQKLDLKAMEQNLTNTLAGIDRLVNSPDLKASFSALNGVLSDTRQLVQNMNSRVVPLTDGIDATLQNARKLVKNLDGQVKPLADNVKRSVDDIDKLTRNADARLDALINSLDITLAGARSVLSQDAPLIVELETALKEISDAARSIRQLANTLDQKPEALIQGLGQSGEK